MDEEASTPEDPETVVYGELVRSRAEEAYELKQEGKTLQQIADQLGYAGTPEVVQAINSQMKMGAEQLSSAGRQGIFQLEMDRLDKLQTAFWPSAMMGDGQSADRVLKIMAMRQKLSGLDTIDTQTQQHTVLVVGGEEADYIAKLKELSS